MTDSINHPPHYKGANGIEAIDVIESFGLGFRLGNLVKYVLRAGRKGAAGPVVDRIAAEIEDLQKARWYLEREIATQERCRDDWIKLERKIERQNQRLAKHKRGRK